MPLESPRAEFSKASGLAHSLRAKSSFHKRKRWRCIQVCNCTQPPCAHSGAFFFNCFIFIHPAKICGCDRLRKAEVLCAVFISVRSGSSITRRHTHTYAAINRRTTKGIGLFDQCVMMMMLVIMLMVADCAADVHRCFETFDKQCEGYGGGLRMALA